MEHILYNHIIDKNFKIIEWRNKKEGLLDKKKDILPLAQSLSKHEWWNTTIFQNRSTSSTPLQRGWIGVIIKWRIEGPIPTRPPFCRKGFQSKVVSGDLDSYVLI